MKKIRKSFKLLLAVVIGFFVSIYAKFAPDNSLAGLLSPNDVYADVPVGGGPDPGPDPCPGPDPSGGGPDPSCPDGSGGGPSCDSAASADY